jgi:hypothetical protein
LLQRDWNEADEDDDYDDDEENRDIGERHVPLTSGA